MDKEKLIELCRYPQERLDTELKSWIDPTKSEGKAKIIKACLALYNYNGGQLLIGFDDKTRDLLPCPWTTEELKKKFHEDYIQPLIGKYASQQFEINVHFVAIDEKTAVVLEVPAGVKYPVAMKKPFDEAGTRNIKQGGIFFRTLSSNNTASSSELKPDDIPRLFDICFANREADIGRFVRRHLTAPSLENLSALLGTGRTVELNDEKSLRLLDENAQRFPSVAEKTGIPAEGDFWELSVWVEGEQKNTHKVSQSWLVAMQNRVPRISGRPLFSASFQDPSKPIYSTEGCQCVVRYRDGQVVYWRITPDGQYYLRVRYLDDINDRIQPGVALDTFLMSLRIYEALHTCIIFARASDFEEDAILRCTIRWNGLTGRKLSSWASPRRFLEGEQCQQDDPVVSSQGVPIDLAQEALPAVVHSIMGPLFVSFEGYEILPIHIESYIQEFLDKGFL